MMTGDKAPGAYTSSPETCSRMCCINHTGQWIAVHCGWRSIASQILVAQALQLSQLMSNMYASSMDVHWLCLTDQHDPPAKDEAHHRRTGNDVGASVSVSAEMRLSMSKKVFLANISNKQALINLFAEVMVKADISVEHAEEGADNRICMVECFAVKKRRTAVVAEDSDVLQLMIHHANATDNSENICMVTAKQTMCITTLKKKLDPALPQSIPILHTLSSGCESTSKPYGLGKVTVLTKYTALKK